MLQSTIYAGINVEKWTDYQPVKCAFEGLISIDLFNRANRSKKYIGYNEKDGEYEIHRQAPKPHLINKVMNNQLVKLIDRYITYINYVLKD